MSVLGIVFLWFANVLLSAFKNLMGIGDFSLDDLSSYLNGLSEVYNIFAWVDRFIDVNVIITLTALTTIFYGYKFTVKIIKFILPFFKK